MAIETGKYLSDAMSVYIKTWITTSDYLKIAKKHGYSTELLRCVANGSRKVNVDNYAAITDLIELAIKNRTSNLPVLNRAHKEAISLIK